MAFLDLATDKLILQVVYDGVRASDRDVHLRGLRDFFTPFRRGELLAFDDAGSPLFTWMRVEGSSLAGRAVRCHLIAPAAPNVRPERRRALWREADVVVLACASGPEGPEVSRDLLDAIEEARREGGLDATPLVINVEHDGRGERDGAFDAEAFAECVADGRPYARASGRADAHAGVREAFVLAMRLGLERLREHARRGSLESLPSRAPSGKDLRDRLLALGALLPPLAAPANAPPEAAPPSEAALRPEGAGVPASGAPAHSAHGPESATTSPAMSGALSPDETTTLVPPPLSYAKVIGAATARSTPPSGGFVASPEDGHSWPPDSEPVTRPSEELSSFADAREAELAPFPSNAVIAAAGAPDAADPSDAGDNGPTSDTLSLLDPFLETRPLGCHTLPSPRPAVDPAATNDALLATSGGGVVVQASEVDDLWGFDLDEVLPQTECTRAAPTPGASRQGRDGAAPDTSPPAARCPLACCSDVAPPAARPSARVERAPTTKHPAYPSALKPSPVPAWAEAAVPPWRAPPSELPPSCEASASSEIALVSFVPADLIQTPVVPTLRPRARRPTITIPPPPLGAPELLPPAPHAE